METYETFEIEKIDNPNENNPIKLLISTNHRFGTDAMLLAKFANTKKSDIVCDLCTGCGIIPALLCRNPEFAPKKIYAVDIAPDAYEMLLKSVEINQEQLNGKIIPVNEDLKQVAVLKESVIARESVDVVTVNPPYFKKDSGETKLSDVQANARHELLCDIDDVCAAADRLLKYGGTLKLCHIPERLADVITSMRKYKLEPKKLIFIHSGKNKPWLFLISGKKGGKSGMTVEFLNE